MLSSSGDPERMSREQLITRVNNLEAEIEALRDAKPEISLRVQQAFGLTEREYRLVMLLADGKPRRKEQILSGLYADRIDDPPEIKIIDVFVCKIRKKLDPYGVRIETLWGSGYHLVDEKGVLQAAIDGLELQIIPVPERTHPPHLLKRQRGIDRQKILASLVANMGKRRLVSFFSRDLAAKTGVKRQVSALLKWMEQCGEIEIVERPPPGGRSRQQWTVRVTAPAMRVAA